MDIVRHYFPGLTARQTEQFASLADVYAEWNARINVVSRKDIGQIDVRHVLHSLAIAKYTSFVPGTRIIDVGTGGGFPGIPLAIMFPEVSFTLVDSIAKKIKVVESVASELGLTNVRAVQSRSESVEPRRFDFVVSRAVTAFPDFVSMTRHLVDTRRADNPVRNGILYLKGGDFDNEIRPFGRAALVVDIRTYFAEEFFETKKLIHLAL